MKKISRSVRRQMKKLGCDECYLTGMRSLTPNGKLLSSSDPRWAKAQFEEMIMVKPSVGIIPPSWVRIS